MVACFSFTCAVGTTPSLVHEKNDARRRVVPQPAEDLVQRPEVLFEEDEIRGRHRD